MDSIAGRAPRHSNITNELLSRVTDEFANPNSPYGLRNQQRTAVTGDTWIRRPKEIINELLSRVTHGFGSPNSP
jgi:hypothetical protein